MGLRQRLASYAVDGAHVLVVEVPGWWPERVAVEQAAASRGWREALSPADADVLVVCGDPGSALAAAADAVWDQLPGPRARVALRARDTAEAVLDDAATLLLDDARQRADARDRAQQPSVDGGMDHGGMDHGGMDHGGMEMAPAGIALAVGGPDRDGLEMDVLHVPLGPVLAHWPAGLVLRCALQGDVVVEATAEVLAGGGARPGSPAAAPIRAARRCDCAARVLAVAGWADAAALARRARDQALAGNVDEAGRLLGRLHAKVGRSWWLRWQLRGLGAVDDSAVEALDLPVSVRGDVRDRLVGMLTRAHADLSGEADGQLVDEVDAKAEARRGEAALAALPGLVTGLDLAAVRLVVASLDPDLRPAGEVNRG